LIGHTNYLLHLHIHHPLSKSRSFNVTLDLILASVTAMTASNWRIQHLYGHHRGEDNEFRGQDLSWEMQKYSPLRVISFCLRSVWPTFAKPVLRCWQLGVLQNVKNPFSYRWGAIEHGLLFLFWLGLIFLNAPLFFFYVIPLYILTYIITRYVDYLNHYGCDESSPNPYEHANNCLNPLFNRLTYNFGYHTAHHLRPDAHWSTLPAIHADIEEHIPARLKKGFSWSFGLMPYHFILASAGKM
jgi:fatty acid desaturase